VLRDLRAFARIAGTLGRHPATRRSFWMTVLDALLHNPRALKTAVSLAGLYLHVGPHAQWLVSRLDRQIAGAEAAERDALEAGGEAPGAPVPATGALGAAP
jgi:hypothetical protein